MTHERLQLLPQPPIPKPPSATPTPHAPAGLMTPSDFVRATSAGIAQIFNLYPRKGLVAAGSDADVIVLDPQQVHTISAASHHSRMDTNIYEGRAIKGRVVSTISRGRLVWHEGVLDVKPGTGRYVAMGTFGPPFDGIDKLDKAALTVPYGDTPVVRVAGGDAGAGGVKDEL
jgi:dihydropyrimidinase